MRRCVPFLVLLLAVGCGGGSSTSSSSGPKTVTPHAAPRAPAPAKDAAPWPAPADPMKLAIRAGLTPETHEFVFLHVHAHLDVFVNGKPVKIPSGIGIDIHNPSVRQYKATDGSMGYGGIRPPCAAPCISPLHTHFVDGVLHTEAKENQFNTLGEFFTEWSVRLDRKCVGGYCKPAAAITIYVNGDPSSGDPREISLEDRTEIAVVIGSPPKTVPSSFG
jgi:hypothetical protein